MGQAGALPRAGRGDSGGTGGGERGSPGRRRDRSSWRHGPATDLPDSRNARQQICRTPEVPGNGFAGLQRRGPDGGGGAAARRSPLSRGALCGGGSRRHGGARRLASETARRERRPWRLRRLASETARRERRPWCSRSPVAAPRRGNRRPRAPVRRGGVPSERSPGSHGQWRSGVRRRRGGSRGRPLPDRPACGGAGREGGRGCPGAGPGAVDRRLRRRAPGRPRARVRW
jgi:hypothetical protein